MSEMANRLGSLDVQRVDFVTRGAVRDPLAPDDHLTHGVSGTGVIGPFPSNHDTTLSTTSLLISPRV